MRNPIELLAADVKAANITRVELESVLYRLSASQRRLFLRLCRGSADTVELRTTCSLGNISETARELNEKLARARDGRRVSCTVRSHTNQFNESTKLGEWSLVGGGDALAAA